MSELLFIPTPNWFISNSLDICPVDGSCATTAINTIILTNDLFARHQFSIKDAHTKRLHAVSFFSQTDSDSKLIASCSEDLDIKVWDARTGALINQHRLHQNPPSCLDWLRVAEDSQPCLVSCDIKGNIYKWSVSTGEHVRFFPENKPITQVASKSTLIAVGYKQGTIVILDIKSEQMKILSKLKNHEDSINCICWFPTTRSNEKSEEEDELIQNQLRTRLGVANLGHVLCSSSEDKTIRLWCALQGRELKCLKAPGVTGSSSKQQHQSHQQPVAKINYTPLCWPSAQFILSGSFKGELSAYDLLVEVIESAPIKWKVFTHTSNGMQGHKKIIYNISSYKDSIVTLSLDRTINTWSLSKLKQESSLSTLNGYVYSITSSPIDPNLLAVSSGDSSIKLLNEKQAVNSFKSVNNSNIKSEITQISWHPTRESIIAFGTKDGKVGLVDVISNKPAQYIFTSYNQSVYTLVWCEQLIRTNQPKDLQTTTSTKSAHNHALYSVADGKIMQHTIQFGAAPAQHTQTINFYNELVNTCGDKNGCEESTTSNDRFAYGNLTELATLQYDETSYFIAVGKFDGSIEIYLISVSSLQQQTSRRLCTYFNHQKLVTNIRWNRAKYSRGEVVLMASGSNDFNVVLVDFGALVASHEPNSFEAKLDAKLFSNFKHKLIGHRERITGLNWSSLNGVNLIASCSYDCTVQIWNGDEGLPLANYRGHSDKLLCCIFSNNDSNIVYSGGEDYCLHRWRLDKQIFKLPPEDFQSQNGKKKSSGSKVAIKRISANSKKSCENSIELNDENANLILRSTASEMTGTNNDNNNTANDSNNESSESSQQTKQVAGKASKRVSSTRSITPFSSKENSTSPIKDIKSLFVLGSHGSKSSRARLQDCIILFNTLYNLSNSTQVNLDLCRLEFPSDSLFLCLFGNRASTCHMLSSEQSELRRLAYDKWWILDIWRGNMARVASELVELGQMTDTLFSLLQLSLNSTSECILSSPLDSYINQLSSREASVDSVHRAVLYALCAYDIERAIRIYTEHKMFAYALCLAQVRLPAGSELIGQVLSRYAAHSAYTGDYETAALCFIRLSEFENAQRALLRRAYKGSEAQFAEQLRDSLFLLFSTFNKNS